MPVENWFAAPSNADAALPRNNFGEIGPSRFNAVASGVQVPVEDEVSQHRLEVVALPAQRVGDVQGDVATGFAERQLRHAEVGQQTVADHRADADRPQPRGEAEEERRDRDAAFGGADARPNAFDDALEQRGVGVELRTGSRPASTGPVLIAKYSLIWPMSASAAAVAAGGAKRRVLAGTARSSSGISPSVVSVRKPVPVQSNSVRIVGS